MTTKTFDLGTVLSIITGRLLTDMGSIYEILNFMTGDDLMTHQLSRASEACEKPLVAQFLKLADIEVPEKFGDDDSKHDLAQAVADWIATQEQIYGATFEVEPLESWESKNPISELAEMTDKPIIAVVTDK